MGKDKVKQAVYMKEYLKKYRLENRERILKQMREYGRKYTIENKEKIRGYHTKHVPDNRKRRAAYLRVYRKENPKKNKARELVSGAIRNGKLIRQNCWCGEIGQAHHKDYNKPYDIEWLCAKHHAECHRKDEGICQSKKLRNARSLLSVKKHWTL